MSYYLLSTLIFNGTSRALWWTGTNFLYVITPSAVYSTVGCIYEWFYPSKTESEMLLEELKEINKHLIELRDSGVVIVDKYGNTQDTVIYNDYPDYTLKDLEKIPVTYLRESGFRENGKRFILGDIINEDVMCKSMIIEEVD